MSLLASLLGDVPVLKYILMYLYKQLFLLKHVVQCYVLEAVDIFY